MTPDRGHFGAIVCLSDDRNRAFFARCALNGGTGREGATKAELYSFPAF